MKQKQSTTITNPRARFDYELKDEYIAGIALTGAEVSSIRQGRAQMRGAFVTIKDREAWLNNVQINPTNNNRANLPEEAQSRARKLLLKKKELAELVKAKEQGNTIVPLKILPKGRYIKAVVAIARGKKKADKRATIKTRETNIEIHRHLKRG
jgi:SsrA-binding protein